MRAFNAVLHSSRSGKIMTAAMLAVMVFGWSEPATTQPLTSQQKLVFEIFKELVEIDTVSDTGDTGRAADEMARRLRAAGFAAADVQVFKPAPRKGNLVVRLRGTGARKPILLLAHLDVVPARPTDWSFDPFKLTEKDGYFYGRGTDDDKYMAASFVANLIRYKAERYKPDRDIVVALTADEEIGGRWGIDWLLKNYRDLVDAEFALNEGAAVSLRRGKPLRVNITAAEKITVNFRLEVKNKGGHSAAPRADNAIYQLAEGLARLSKFSFPFSLNATSRGFFEQVEKIETPQTAAAIRSVLSGREDAAAVVRLSTNLNYNAQLHTTCVATLLEAGQAANALPQTARATINCRILPNEQVDDVRATLVRVLADERISVSQPGQPEPAAPSVLDKQLLETIEKTAAEFWPGAPVVTALSTGSSDSRLLRRAGIPTFGHSGLASDGNEKPHGKDERVTAKSFFEGDEYLYRLVKRLSGGK